MSKKKKENNLQEQDVSLDNFDTAPSESKKKEKHTKQKKEKKPNTLFKIILAGSVLSAFLVAVIILSLTGLLKFPPFNDSSLNIKLSEEKETVQVENREKEKPEFVDPDGMTDEEIQEELEDSYHSFDPEDYFNEIGTLTEKTSVYDSDAVPTEEEVRAYMEACGFGDCKITTNYDMDGKYYDDEEIRGNSEQHPIYDIEYTDTSDRLWHIEIINGVLSANLLQYSAENPDAPPIYLSEKDYLVGYASSTNTFYLFKPKAEKAVLKTVQGINATVLNEFKVS